ncbi:MAG: indolepyruvate oxidoreductase subunit beta [Deltaproteobacteria bacterium]|nr:MAG: indolepyruvate oxidoreductase subunit beta [Deltaproteobacteria bacterium]
MENSTTNILVAGVGGQGVILASDIMSEVFMEAGYDVKKSEIHGMAMRGGIVTSHFRFGKKVYSPLIKEGEVDILFAFEQLEGLRWVNHLRPDGKIVMNDHRINPPVVNLGEMQYPQGIPEKIGSKFKGFYLIKGTEIALKIGDVRAANVVLLGAMSKLFDVKEETWLTTILNHLPPKVHELNKKAFAAGREEIAQG